MIKLEICTSSLESVFAAEAGGAERIELCCALEKGGITPPLSWAEIALQKTSLTVFILIRPRSGDFLYSEIEFLSMKRDIIHFGEIGCHGVVFGILNKDGKVDIERNIELLELAKKYNMECTFHRAIDRTENIFDAMEDIINIGFDRILTSGGKDKAMNAKENLQKMIIQANNKIIILPGGGINENNILDLATNLDTKEFHGSFSESIESNMIYKKSDIDTIENDYSTSISSIEKIKRTKNILNNINR